MNEQSLTPETNTTDATVGQSLPARVAARKTELEAALADPATGERTRADLQTALSQVEGLLTGDLDRIPRTVSASLSTWLEANKHLDEHHSASASASASPLVAESCEPTDVDEPPAADPGDTPR